jgi:glycosyltransferase involved in cell wall biosynthesis
MKMRNYKNNRDVGLASEVNKANVQKERMTIVIGCYYPKQKEELILKRYCKKSPVVSNLQYERVLWSGIKQREKNAYFISAPTLGKYPFSCKKMSISFSSDEKNVIVIKYLTLPLIIYKSKQLAIEKGLKAIISKVPKDFLINIIISEAHLPYLAAVCNIKKKFKDRLFCTTLIPDAPENIVDLSGNLLKRFMVPFYISKTYHLLKLVSDRYLFFSNGLSSIPAFKGTPFTVFNGIVDRVYSDDAVRIKNRIVYTGALTYGNGISTLLEAFSKLNCDAELWVAGAGPCEEMVKKASLSNGKIHFCGFLNEDKTELLLKSASVLVAPRHKSKLTNFSFPSKVIKYLCFPANVVSFDLECYSDELRDIMFIPNDESPDELANTLRRSLSTDSIYKLSKREKFLNSIDKDKIAQWLLK